MGNPESVAGHRWTSWQHTQARGKSSGGRLLDTNYDITDAGLIALHTLAALRIRTMRDDHPVEVFGAQLLQDSPGTMLRLQGLADRRAYDALCEESDGQEMETKRALGLMPVAKLRQWLINRSPLPADEIACMKKDRLLAHARTLHVQQLEAEAAPATKHKERVTLGTLRQDILAQLLQQERDDVIADWARRSVLVEVLRCSADA